MPQFDVNFFSSQLFWLVIVFSLLYFIVSKFIAPKAEYILISRNRCFEDNIGYAEEYNTKIKTLNEYKVTLLAEINTQIEDRHKGATKSLEDNFLEQKAEAAGTIAKQRTKTLQKLDKEIDGFRKSQGDSVINLASFIIHKITNKPADLKRLQKIHGKMK